LSLRQKLLLLFSLIVAAAVAVVAWTVLLRIRQVFEQQDQEKTQLLLNQFQREFQHRSLEVTAAIDRLSDSDRMRRMAEELGQSSDASSYLTEAQSLATEAQVDFLEIVGPDGNIVSSAQSPARFGYPEPAINSESSHGISFIKREELPDGSSALGIFAVRPVHRVAQQVWIIGGKRLDRAFLADLPLPAGVQAFLYDASESSAAGSGSHYDPAQLMGAAGAAPNGDRYRPLIESAMQSGQQATSVIYLTQHREDSVLATVLPLTGEGGHVMAMLVVAASRRQMVEAQQHIRSIAYSVAATGILLAIAVSMWIAARISRPIEELARAAEEVAQGNWETRVEARGRDEIATLGRSFNHMTSELSAQREQLIQSERVAAWRELARRLAHELKNPLFPLQITIENLTRARQLPSAEFDEVFVESTRTLSLELANLKTIIGRFSDFSRMPRPQLERVDAAEAMRRVARLYFPSASTNGDAKIETGSNRDPAGNPAKIQCRVEASDLPLWIDADPELLHRALSNLALNAMDAMPDGGSLTLSARSITERTGERIEMRVADTGSGLTPEECERLFTPYYTTKEHGTGLGLAIVQSVVADHGATITVESQQGQGTTFVITFQPSSQPNPDRSETAE
jgi:nitrogen fixation/metabolism regulation signal transduction histidine kinase